MLEILFSTIIWAALIDTTASYKPDPQIKKSLPKFSAPPKPKVVFSSRLESFSGGGSKPGVVTYTSQTFLFDDRNGDKQKVSYDALTTSSTVTVPGFSKPMVNRHDFSSFLKGSELNITWKDREVESVDGLDRLKKDLDSRITNSVMKMGLNQVFGEVVIKSTLSSLHPENFCVQEISGKKIGEIWKGIRKTGSATLAYECNFEGWVKQKEESLALVKITIPRQNQSKSTGAPADGKIEGDGRMVWHPPSGELFSVVKTKVVLDPTASVPADNRSFVENRMHFEPRK